METNHVNDEQQLFAGFKTAFESFATEAIHVGQEPEQWNSMAVVPPVSLSTTFKQLEPGKHMVSTARTAARTRVNTRGAFARGRSCRPVLQSIIN